MQKGTSIALENLASVSALVKKREVSPVGLVQECLSRIDQYDAVLNSFIRVYAEQAMEQARDAEQEIMGGRWRGPLHGIPVAIKDLIDIKGEITTAASRLLLKNVATEDAEVVKR